MNVKLAEDKTPNPAQPEAHTGEVSPAPLLEALARYEGTIIDTSLHLTVDGGALRQAQEALVRQLKNDGFSNGDRIIVAISNGPLFLALWTAILELGGSPIPVHSQVPAEELRRIGERFHVRFVVTNQLPEESLRADDTVLTVLEAFSQPMALLCRWGVRGKTGFAEKMECFMPGVPLHPTSGTTGTPKLAVRPVLTGIEEIVNYVETFGISSDDTILNMTPMCHAYGHGFGVIGTLWTSANLVTMQKFQPSMVVEACRNHPVTIFPAAASILDTLIFTAGNALFDPERKVFTGGGPMNARTAERFKTQTGTYPRPLYGSTEAGGIAVVRPGQAALNGCVGPAFANVEIELRITDSDNIPDGAGLIHVRSKSLMAGYLEDEKVTFRDLEGGWFNTGDLGYYDEQGRLMLCGRVAEVINVSGMKVLPAEVEEVIKRVPGVVEVKVYGKRNRTGYSLVCAAVVAEEGVTAQAIQQECERGLVYYKRPAKISLMEQLPKNSSGKIIKEFLP